MTQPNLDTVLAAARGHLLAWRTPAGHWEGRLASSALATATAAWALHVAERDRGPGPFSRLVQPALDWLARHQRRDGGWGDTVLSCSNVSTTVLAWSALAASDGRDAHTGAARRAEAYVAEAAGGLEPESVAESIIAAYGEDKTFSAPILMTAAMAGRLGPEEEAWRRVPALPFELAALPAGWWKRLRLGVVSYALPALIAIGQARLRRAPPRCPLRRLVRRAAVGPTLARLSAIQPASGGFLEAVPLTSFVAMALAAAGQAQHPVLGRCIAFLERTVRDEGAWPIDTNLATWVTTLSVQALAVGALPGESAAGRSLSRAKPRGTRRADEGAVGSETHRATRATDLDTAILAEDRRRLADWLLDQQHTEVHPYTRAEPGGWAWTDLAGGVPDADDTAGALVALAHLVPDDARAADAAAQGVRWLLGLQNRDGGVPTFCRGWGRLPFDRSSPDLTAHALTAWSAWRDRLPPTLGARTDAAAGRAIAYLARTQRPDGAWVPLWFGNEHVPDESNPTYGTARVVAALCQVTAAGTWTEGTADDAASQPGRMAARGAAWLLSAQQTDGGWDGDADAPPSIEETALATDALARWAASVEPTAVRAAGVSPRVRPPARESLDPGERTRDPFDSAAPRSGQALTVAARPAQAADAARRGAEWLVRATRGGTALEPAPIGFYFARLWYFERLYPVIFTVGALARVRALGDASR